jgi:hypothetical protein
VEEIAPRPKTGIVKYEVRVPPHWNVCVPGRQHYDIHHLSVLYIDEKPEHVKLNTGSSCMLGLVEIAHGNQIMGNVCGLERSTQQ